MGVDDIFNDLDNFRALPLSDGTERKSALSRTRRRVKQSNDKHFAKTNLKWSKQMAKVLHSSEQMLVLMHLVNRATFSDEPIPATSQNTGDVPCQNENLEDACKSWCCRSRKTWAGEMPIGHAFCRESPFDGRVKVVSIVS
jgi:hypothetical protein